MNPNTDYGRPDREQPSLHGRKFTPTPKFLGMAAAYFVCHIGPNFQVSLIFAFIGCPQSVFDTMLLFSSTLISLINIAPTLTNFEKFHPPQKKKNPPSTFIDSLDFFHPPLLVYQSYVLVFDKKSHPPRLFQPPCLLKI